MSKSVSPTTVACESAQLACGNSAQCPYALELAAAKQELLVLNTLVRTDELTGLFNFRHFQHSIDLEMERTRRSGHSMALLMVDLDHFKLFNDRWGHEVGNLALQHVSRIIKKSLRRLDVPCRFGGEEFAIILPDTNLHAAIKLAQRLRLNIQESMVCVEDEAIKVTASIGVDVFTANDRDDISGFIARTDAWLYESKNSGRNCVCHPEDREPTHVSKEEREFLLGDF